MSRYRPPKRRTQPPVSAEEQRAAGLGCLVLIGIVILASFGSCVANNAAPPPPPAGTQPPDRDAAGLPTPGRIDGPQPPQVTPCSYPPAAYDGQSCFPGGEPVKVTRVIDGDTVELADRRTVRLLGVDAPEANTCAGPGATNFTRGKVEGKWVLMHREPGVTVDRYNRELAYLQPPADIGGQYTPAYYQDDLGYELTFNGWAEPFADSDANATYNRSIQSAYESAKLMPHGQFAAPCGSPETYTPAPNYDVPNPGDGDDGENFICRRKWWC